MLWDIIFYGILIVYFIIASWNMEGAEGLCLLVFILFLSLLREIILPFLFFVIIQFFI
jgi:hypothetical protein